MVSTILRILTDLMWYVDNSMLEFLAQWDFILDHLEGDTLETLHANGDKTLRDLLFRQVEKSPALADDVAHYKRVGIRHEDQSYKFLRDVIERAVDTTHQRKIVEERRNAIRSGRTNLAEGAAAPAVVTAGAGGAQPTQTYPGCS